jgi:hypothetical protein
MSHIDSRFNGVNVLRTTFNPKSNMGVWQASFLMLDSPFEVMVFGLSKPGNS